MTESILKSFDIWTAVQGLKSKGRVKSIDNISLEGIAKLRELILELAFRGKLVSQNLQEEAASVLLQKIEVERKQLIKNGLTIKDDAPAKIKQQDELFHLPHGWEWTRIRNIGHDWGQKTPDSDFTYIEVSAIDNAKGKLTSPAILSAKDAPSRARKIVKTGTVIYSTVRPYLKNICLIDDELSPEPIASTAFAIVHPYLRMPGKFFVYYFRSPIFVSYVESVQTGIAYPAINDKQFFNAVIPLPPLAEQHRIVAKVDELMALCDELEAVQTTNLKTHQALVKTLLQTLTQAANEDELHEAWQRMAPHFDTLFCTEDSIEQLKQTILQLAIMGRLVKQSPADEPATALLKRIKAEKAKSFPDRGTKKGADLPAISADEIPFELPEGWVWCRLGDITTNVDYGTSEKATEIGEIPILRMGNVQEGKVVLNNLKYVKKAIKDLPRLFLKRRDIIFNRTNSYELVGKCGIFEGADDEYTLASYLIRVSVPHNLMSVDYVNYYVNSPNCRETQIEPQVTQQTGQANFSGGKLKNILIPLPPLAEQQRIVAKVQQLQQQLSQLESRLQQSSIYARQLMETVLQQAFDEKGKLYELQEDVLSMVAERD